MASITKAPGHDQDLGLRSVSHRTPEPPAMPTASVDIDDYGRVVSSPVKAYHLSGRCYEEYRAAEAAHRKALLAA